MGILGTRAHFKTVYRSDHAFSHWKKMAVGRMRVLRRHLIGRALDGLRGGGSNPHIRRPDQGATGCTQPVHQPSLAGTGCVQPVAPKFVLSSYHPGIHHEPSGEALESDCSTNPNSTPHQAEPSRPRRPSWGSPPSRPRRSPRCVWHRLRSPRRYWRGQSLRSRTREGS